MEANDAVFCAIGLPSPAPSVWPLRVTADHHLGDGTARVHLYLAPGGLARATFTPVAANSRQRESQPPYTTYLSYSPLVRLLFYSPSSFSLPYIAPSVGCDVLVLVL